MTAIAILHREEIIAKVASGVFVHRAAEALGIAGENVSKHFAGDPEYEQAKEIGAEQRLNRAAEMVHECAIGQTVTQEDGQLVRILDERGSLARAREAAFRTEAWMAERQFPHRWGQKNQVHLTGTLTLDAVLSAMDEPVAVQLPANEAAQE